MYFYTYDTDAAGSEKMQKTDKAPDRKHKGNDKGGNQSEQSGHAEGGGSGTADGEERIRAEKGSFKGR